MPWASNTFRQAPSSQYPPLTQKCWTPWGRAFADLLEIRNLIIPRCWVRPASWDSDMKLWSQKWQHIYRQRSFVKSIWVSVTDATCSSPRYRSRSLLGIRSSLACCRTLVLSHLSNEYPLCLPTHPLSELFCNPFGGDDTIPSKPYANVGNATLLQCSNLAFLKITEKKSMILGNVWVGVGSASLCASGGQMILSLELALAGRCWWHALQQGCSSQTKLGSLEAHRFELAGKEPGAAGVGGVLHDQRQWFWA